MNYAKYFAQAEGRSRRYLHEGDANWDELLMAWDKTANDNHVKESLLEQFIECSIDNIKRLLTQTEKHWNDSRNEILRHLVAPQLQNTTALTEFAIGCRQTIDSLKEVLALKEAGINSIVDKKVLLTIEM